jgi:hypothetical protein
MNKNARDLQLREALARHRAVNFPGVGNLKPVRLVHRVLGDGRQLVAFQPMNTGANYYVLRVDSAWRLSDAGEGGPLFCDHIGEIIAAIEEQFGRAWCEGDPPAKSRDNGRPFHPTKEDCGCRWFSLKWPDGLEPPSIATVETVESPAAARESSFPAGNCEPR